MKAITYLADFHRSYGAFVSVTFTLTAALLLVTAVFAIDLAGLSYVPETATVQSREMAAAHVQPLVGYGGSGTVIIPVTVAATYELTITLDDGESASCPVGEYDYRTIPAGSTVTVLLATGRLFHGTICSGIVVE